MKHVSVLVTQDSIIAAIGNTHYMFGKVNDFLKERGQPPFFNVQLVGLLSEVKLNDGMYTVQTDTTIRELEKTDLILIPPSIGGIQSNAENNRKFLPWIRGQYQRGAEVGSLCVGAFLLAETGLLDGRWCSTHWKTANQFRSYYPKVKLVDQKIITDDQGLYTSGGANSYWNLLIYLVRKFTSHEIAVQVSKYFEIDIDRDNQGLYSSFEGSRFHLDEPIHRIQNYLDRNFHEHLNLQELSALAMLSHRTFQRRFKKATHHTVFSYLQKIRVEAAKRLLEQNSLTVSEIMYEVGYQDPEAFRKIFRRETSLSPQQYRAKYDAGK